jgi:hypothetical protein
MGIFHSEFRMTGVRQRGLLITRYVTVLSGAVCGRMEGLTCDLFAAD